MTLSEPEPVFEPRKTRHVQFPPGYYSRDVFDQTERINATWTEELPDSEDEFLHDKFAMLTHYALASSPGDEPTISEALHGPDAEKWQMLRTGIGSKHPRLRREPSGLSLV
jgi:hypothetical protein